MNETISRFPLQWPHGWPRVPSYKRKVSRFARHGRSITTNVACERVLGELARMHVREGDVVISTNLKTRLDGLPLSGQGTPADPGAAVYWRTPGGEVKVMAVDVYTDVASNIAAIAATLEAMRAIERHGGAQILERAFVGFDALPPPAKGWREVLGVPTNASLEAVRAAYRALAAVHHPDRGGSGERMAEINAAWDAAREELAA